jgi:hypothetical protein
VQFRAHPIRRLVRIAALSALLVVLGLSWLRASGSAEPTAITNPRLLSLDCTPGERLVAMEIEVALDTLGGPRAPEEALKQFLNQYLPDLSSAVFDRADQDAATTHFVYRESDRDLVQVDVESRGDTWLGTGFIACASAVDESK